MRYFMRPLYEWFSTTAPGLENRDFKDFYLKKKHFFLYLFIKSQSENQKPGQLTLKYIYCIIKVENHCFNHSAAPQHQHKQWHTQNSFCYFHQHST